MNEPILTGGEVALIVFCAAGLAATFVFSLFSLASGEVTSTCHRCGGKVYTHPRPWLCDRCAGDFGTEVEP